MALTITSVVKENGAACNHLVVTVNVEGVTRTFKTTLAEIDEMVPDNPNEAIRLLVVLWVKYRRTRSRAIENVGIA